MNSSKQSSRHPLGDLPELQIRLHELSIKERETALKEQEILLKEKDLRHGTLRIIIGLSIASLPIIGIVTQNIMAQQLERQKFKSSIVLSLIETGDQGTATRNIKAFIAAGLIKDPDGKIAALVENPDTVPVLPAQDSSQRATLALFRTGADIQRYCQGKFGTTFFPLKGTTLGDLYCSDGVSRLPIVPEEACEWLHGTKEVIFDSRNQMWQCRGPA